jgi:hypothetical protein
MMHVGCTIWSLACVAMALRGRWSTWDSHVISCAEERGYDYVVEWAREMVVLNHKLDHEQETLICS